MTYTAGGVTHVAFYGKQMTRLEDHERIPVPPYTPPNCLRCPISIPMHKVSCTFHIPTSGTSQRTKLRVAHHPETLSNRSHRRPVRIPRDAQRRRERAVLGVRRQRLGDKSFGQQPYRAEMHQDRAPVLVNAEVGVVHVGLGEHHAVAADADGSHHLLGPVR